MNRISHLFDRKKGGILSIYFTAGFPKRDDTEEIILALDEAGVDLIEVGMPYSDPLADGPTIQDSSTKALKNGMELSLLFNQIESVRTRTQMPLILMGYFNQVMQYGEEKFFKKCKEVGIDGLILPDLPLFEYETQYKSLFEELDLGISFLLTPQTTKERIQKIDALSRGFVYVVADSSTTGTKNDITSRQIDYFEKIQMMLLENPTIVGFGISSHESFSTACRYANGAIIGSAFIRMLEKAHDIKNDIQAFISTIKSNE
ncbi:MAG: tryptophan synthase subunit alpha [Bacteroidetes bacterium]|nr:tryptophan synthase subunit alpha [Bacteroidota bacterium]